MQSVRLGISLLRKTEERGEGRGGEKRKKQLEAEGANNSALGLHAAEEEVAGTSFTINITKLF